jgi:excinuclease ABC subunit C
MKDMISQRLRQIKTSGHLEKYAKPDLMIIDGGRGHKSVVMEAMMEEGIFLPFVCIAKGEERNAGREEFFTSTKDNIALDFQSPEMFYLQTLRDEAHRFAIRKHRQKKTSKSTSSELDKIPSVGKARKIALLSYFSSVEEIKKASIETIQKVEGINKRTAENIYLHFKK